MLFLNKKFDSRVWKEEPSKRKNFIKDIQKKNIAINKTKEEVEKLFGMDNNIPQKERWSYFLYKDFWNKGKDYVMALYFEGDRVVRMEIECRYKEKFRVLV